VAPERENFAEGEPRNRGRIAYQPIAVFCRTQLTPWPRVLRLPSAGAFLFDVTRWAQDADDADVARINKCYDK
jgi:hypothetical protein